MPRLATASTAFAVTLGEQGPIVPRLATALTAFAVTLGQRG